MDAPELLSHAARYRALVARLTDEQARAGLLNWRKGTRHSQKKPRRRIIQSLNQNDRRSGRGREMYTPAPRRPRGSVHGPPANRRPPGAGSLTAPVSLRRHPFTPPARPWMRFLQASQSDVVSLMDRLSAKQCRQRADEAECVEPG